MNRWLALIGILFINVAYAQDEGILNKLLAPGPLVLGHSKLEQKDCLKCHEAGKGVSDGLCLNCHGEIKEFVVNKRGFHGLTEKSCRECHLDHKGRNFDSMAIDTKNFNHGLNTGYKLEGKHAQIKCEDCHKEKYDAKFVRKGKTRFMGKQSSCVSCHRKDDIHGFTGGFAKKDCLTCHSLNSWKHEVKFDHNRDTKYQLQGKHTQLKCADCHGINKTTHKKHIYHYPQLKTQACLTCHQDFHKNNLSKKFQGGACAKCHTQEKWKIETFDHSITGYKISGKHAKLNCVECHKQKSTRTELKNFAFAGLRSQCLSCHKDFHKFGKFRSAQIRNPNQCQSCHTDESWKQIRNFDHNRSYVIDGEHEKLKCAECHLPKNRSQSIGIYHFQSLRQKTCETCHKTPHVGQFSPALLAKKCTECHVTTGWFEMRGAKAFDHSKTRFPLTGAHSNTRCSDCHGPAKKQVFKFKSPGLKFCIDCHTNIHTKQFSNRLPTQDCTQCHATTNFKDRTEFDHKRTRYPLEGAHTKLKCQECHKPQNDFLMLTKPNVKAKEYPEGRKIQLTRYLFPNLKNAANCTSCHADFHKGQLSSDCVSCHSINTWKNPKFDHNKQSVFMLRGKHETLLCNECHKPISNQFVTVKDRDFPLVRYKPLSQQCADCHKDPHRGSFGRQCTDCHTERGWKITKDFHKNFALSGVHYTLECAECHKEGRKLAGLSQQCVSCHAKDDIHNGTLPKCDECHKQQFWDVTGFRHSLTRFPLRGAHRTIDCMSCHRLGTYKGLNSDCSSCHLADAQGATSFSHSPITTYLNCASCHRNQFTFQSAN